MFPDFSVALHQIVADVMNICLGTLVPVLLALGVRYANKRWGLNIQAEQQAQIENLGRQAVMVASQTISGNENKKAISVNALLGDAARIGFKITAAKASDIIEAQINRLKRERGAAL